MNLSRWRFHALLIPTIPFMVNGYLTTLGLPGFLPPVEIDSGAGFARIMIGVIGTIAWPGLTILVMQKEIR